MKLGTKYRPLPQETIYLLEVLRFIACVGVILYHYQHFVTYRGGIYEPSQIPLNSFFKWFYTNGGSGVQVFWCLSGIVFAHVYQIALLKKKIGAVDFIWRRIARLYPLHLLTLLAVCALLVLLRATSDLSNFVYQFNDLEHFFLNLGFANYWGFQSGTSFNGPVWSVSIELIAYAFFLGVILCVRFLPKYFRKNGFLLLVWVPLLLITYSRISAPSDFIAICISLFLIGAITYTLWHLLPNSLVAICLVYLAWSHYSTDSIDSSLQRMGLPFGSLMIGVFVLLLGFSRQFARLKANRSVATNLGSITYSMYMIHFPIQFLMVLFSENIIRLDFLTIPVFLVFFVITTVVSVACNKTFETKIQRYLRSIFPRSSQSRGENVINKPQHQESEAG